MKIVYCLNSIRCLGGIQRVTIAKANALSEVEGNEVYVVVTDNKNETQVAELSPNVHLVDLNINYFDGDRGRSKVANILVYKRKQRQHKVLLYEFLKRIKPDIVISVGGFEKYILLSMKNRTWKVIREFHFERKYRLKYSRTRFDKLVATLTDFYDFYFKEHQYDRIVLLTEEDHTLNWRGWKKITVIPNPLSFSCEVPSRLEDKVVIYAGRLDPIKNCQSLVRVFQIVAQHYPNWILRLYGDGSERTVIQKQIIENNLQNNVFLMGFSSDIKEAYNQASIAVLTSKCEGFCMSIVEAMECGVPNVSYQCPCGPGELISEGKDGFLVPVGDERLMAERICTLIEDESLRKSMGRAAKVKAQNYHIESIVGQWMDLFRELCAGR